MMLWLRWLLVIPAATAGWFFALAFGFVLLHLLDALCPPEQMVSGMCTAPWYDAGFKAATLIGASLAAFLVVALASVAAPAHRTFVSWLAFGCGAAFALYAAFSTRSYAELAFALVSGLVAVWTVNRLLR